ncbi:MAG: class I SAM-dependent methyltransferase [Phycisphaerae bacterium]|nr:class I SAM-dependent methyltransferase [Phycisphaerae bacterium]
MLALCHRIADRARWEWREWKNPSAPSFLQEELDHALLDQVHWRPREKVLDVGCAHGHYLRALDARGASPTGIDISLQALHKAKASNHIVVTASGLALPFADESFDTVLCHKTMHLFPRPKTVAKEFNRILRPGGRVVFSTSNPASPYARIARAATRNGRNPNWRSENHWSAADWCRAFAGCGLRTRSIYSCNLVWPWVFRACDRWIVPNEWMRRYNRWIRRIANTPLRTNHPHGAAMDYVLELAKPETPHPRRSRH